MLSPCSSFRATRLRVSSVHSSGKEAPRHSKNLHSRRLRSSYLSAASSGLSERLPSSFSRADLVSVHSWSLTTNSSIRSTELQGYREKYPQFRKAHQTSSKLSASHPAKRTRPSSKASATAGDSTSQPAQRARQRRASYPT